MQNKHCLGCTIIRHGTIYRRPKCPAHKRQSLSPRVTQLCAVRRPNRCSLQPVDCLKFAAKLVECLKDKRIPYSVYDPGQGIRATVIGASQYSVQVSGNTILIAGKGSLPLRNIPVLHLPSHLDGDIVPQDLARDIQHAFESFDLVEGDNPPVRVAFGRR